VRRIAISAVEVGDTLEVLATDPRWVNDLEAFGRAAGHDLLESGEHGGVFRCVPRRGR
jgi:TusA-related sulfurtransferase